VSSIAAVSNAIVALLNFIRGLQQTPDQRLQRALNEIDERDKRLRQEIIDLTRERARLAAKKTKKN
jgi:hypothetical protein